MPPSSSLFAERPVPAPPPMIGSPRAICSRKRLRIAVLVFVDLFNRAALPTRTPAAASSRSPLRRLAPFVWLARPARSRAALRSVHQLDQLLRGGVGELRIVDVQIELDRPPRRQSRSDRVVQRPPRRRIVERLPLASIADTPRAGSSTATGPRAAASLRAISAPIAALSSGGRAHQRDVGVVAVEQPVRELRGHRVEARRS